MAKLKSDTRWAWKAVKLTLTTRNGFAWPSEGTVKASGPFLTSNTTPCPGSEGDGLCLAKTPAGAASGGYGLFGSVILLVSFSPADVLGEDNDKVRVKKCRTHGALDAKQIMLRPRADLSRADLSEADLSEADLSGADLSGANLSGANLSEADLSGADLYGADLSEANLSRANLSRANLSRADLSGAYGTDTARMPEGWRERVAK